MEKQGGKCCYCSRLIFKDRPDGHPQLATLEHLNRRANGGANHPDNLALACFPCNAGRGQIDWLTYKSWIEEIHLAA